MERTEFHIEMDDEKWSGDPRFLLKLSAESLGTADSELAQSKIRVMFGGHKIFSIKKSPDYGRVNHKPTAFTAPRA